MIKCDCGGTNFFRFGPYSEERGDEPGLRMIYTCTRCGGQLRIYQASKMLRFEAGVAKEG